MCFSEKEYRKDKGTVVVRSSCLSDEEEFSRIVIGDVDL